MLLIIPRFVVLLIPFLSLPQGIEERSVTVKEKSSIRPWPSILGWASQDVLYRVVAKRGNWYIIRFPTRSHPEALGKLRTDTVWEKEGGRKVRINSPRLSVLGVDFPLRIGEKYAAVEEREGGVRILYPLNGQKIPLWISSLIVETPEEAAKKAMEEEGRKRKEGEERRKKKRRKKAEVPPRPAPPPEQLVFPERAAPLPESVPARRKPKPEKPESKGGEDPKKKPLILKEAEPLVATVKRLAPIVAPALVLVLVLLIFIRKKRGEGTPRINKAEKTLNRFYLKGRVFFREGKYEEAIAEWEKALKIRPTHLEVKELIEKAERKIEERDKQLREIQERYFRGRRFFREGRYKETIDEWEQVLAYDLGSVNLKLLISEVKGKLEEMKTREKEEPQKIKVQHIRKGEQEDYEEKIAALQNEIERRLGLSDDIDE